MRHPPSSNHCAWPHAPPSPPPVRGRFATTSPLLRQCTPVGSPVLVQLELWRIFLRSRRPARRGRAILSQDVPRHCFNPLHPPSFLLCPLQGQGPVSRLGYAPKTKTGLVKVEPAPPGADELMLQDPNKPPKSFCQESAATHQKNRGQEEA